jgi:hypothetical protein
LGSVIWVQNHFIPSGRELGPMRDPETMEGWGHPDSEARRSRSFSPKDVEVDGRQALKGLSLRGRSVEGLAYLTVLIGIVGDHISTRIGLLCPRIGELNPFTVYLRQNGLWLPFDVFLLVVSLGLPALLMRKWSFRGRWAVLAFPVIFGLARLFAAMHNIIMMILYS